MAHGTQIHGQMDVVNVIQEKAREVIGQPKPTFVHRKKKARSNRGGLKFTQRAGVDGCADLTKPETILLPDVPVMAVSPWLRGTRVHVPVTPKRPREYRVPPVTFHYTKEAIAYANFLMKTQGAMAMNQYLAKQRSALMTTSHTEIAEQLTEKKEKETYAEVVVGGSIQHGLDNARAQAEHYEKEASRFKKLADQYRKAADKLEEALTLFGEQTDAEHGDNGRRQSRPVGFWNNEIKESAASLPADQREMKRGEWITLLQKRTGANRAAIYASFNSAIKKGIVVEVADRKTFRYVGEGE